MLRASGPDAPAFLQGQFTNDLGRISPGEAVYGLWLDRKGRVIADSHVLREAGGAGFWVVSLSSPAEIVLRRLQDFIIADEVEISDETPGFRGVSLVGEGAAAWLAGEPRAGFAFPGRRGLPESREWIFPDLDAGVVEAALAAARTIADGELESARIAAAIPAIPADIGPSDLPNEGGLEAEAISYSKGCYLGQEVMARIKSLGRVRRTLVRVHGTGLPPPLPAPLWDGDKREGELRTVAGEAGGAGFAGLALVSVAGAASGRPLATFQGGPPSVNIARK